MLNQGPRPTDTDPNADRARQYDGIERIPFLPDAEFITVAPSTSVDDPVDVTIEWAPGHIEKPLPGSALWRAVLESRLAPPATPDPADRLIRHQILGSLARFPDLETWWAWIRTGWTAPPKPASRPRRDRSLRAWLQRFRRR